MSIKRIGAVTVVAGAVMFPLAACGSSTPPAPTVTTSARPLSQGFRDSYCNINAATKDACEQSDSTVAKQQAAERAAASRPATQGGGLPWWSWLLIVPAALIALIVIGIKLMEANDERTISRAQARVAELDARPRAVLDYDDYEDDELDEEDMSFLDKVTDPAPSAPAQPAPPAGGGLLSSLRQQSQ